ncbi:gamma carbonic anhydrase family protein [Candidatus Nitrospira allomarina]|jgi:gamma-carbonic anhydrase|uniref:Gamma carbonic anhydrase family protein n=1 Tax=Candidatus Nitrospira allomarina TaxID=3020900 RepID=A0AA96JUA0_9BACT|nr:gamma carbonic anhydrase family protein [Candidatus Nitrospira allomarina]WNM59910.1 gamma carbonic anhydrase family protein [Candidatus Nitrospira allomarina]
MLRTYRGIAPTVATSAFIEDTAVVIGDVAIGSESSVWFHAVVRGDVHSIRIGHRTNIQDLCLLHVTHDTHPLTLGDDITVGHHVVLHGCTVHDRVLIGMGTIIMDGAVIEEDCVIGAGALITRNIHIPSRSLVMGSPAKVKRLLTDAEVQWIKESAANYIRYAQQYVSEQNE